jgi:acyl carrier protein phosphodiesterase
LNVLAHALLAGDDPALRLGGMLGDFVRGTPPDRLPPRVRDGIRLHRAIDGYTDSHPVVLAARQGMPPPFRRYAGILLDVWFDHCLARDFGRYSDEPLPRFSTRFRQELHQARAMLPDDLRRFLAYMDTHDLPAGYGDLRRVEGAFAGLSRRLSRANPVADAIPLLVEQDESLQSTFAAFFPQLQAFAAQWIAENPDPAPA